MLINVPLLFFLMVTIFEEYLVRKRIGNSLYGHQRTNPEWTLHACATTDMMRLNFSLLGSNGEMMSFKCPWLSKNGLKHIFLGFSIPIFSKTIHYEQIWSPDSCSACAYLLKIPSRFSLADWKLKFEDQCYLWVKIIYWNQNIRKYNRSVKFIYGTFVSENVHISSRRNVTFSLGFPFELFELW